MKLWSVVATSLLLAACATSPARLIFPAAYQLIDGDGHSPGSSEALLYFYDEPSGMSVVGRRDSESVHIGEGDEIHHCSVGDYCVRIDEAPGPLVVFAEPETSIDFDGWRYDVERNVYANQGCDRFTARKDGSEEWFTYVNCGFLGLATITSFEGQRIFRALELRSYSGLGAYEP